MTFSAVAAAQQQPPTVHSSLLDHFVGRWVLRYTMKGVPHTHDVTGRWVLQHHYLKLSEVSREKARSGFPQYVADVYITRDTSPSEYVVFWLDDFGGSVPPSIGHAVVNEHHMRFLFRDSAGVLNFVNDMTYDTKTGSWLWVMDNVDRGKFAPFARMKLTRTG